MLLSEAVERAYTILPNTDETMNMVVAFIETMKAKEVPQEQRAHLLLRYCFTVLEGQVAQRVGLG